MIEIKKGPMTITRTKNDIMQFTDTSDGLYIKFVDEVEIIIPIKLDANQKAAIVTAARMNITGFVLDLNKSNNIIQVTV